jgi:hypothetical protein
MLLNIKCAFWFSIQLLSKAFLIVRNVQWSVVINVKTSSCKFPPHSRRLWHSTTIISIPCVCFSISVSQLFLSRSCLPVCSQHGCVSTQETDDNRSATNFPDIIAHCKVFTYGIVSYKHIIFWRRLMLRIDELPCLYKNFGKIGWKRETFLSETELYVVYSDSNQRCIEAV